MSLQEEEQYLENEDEDDNDEEFISPYPYHILVQ